MLRYNEAKAKTYLRTSGEMNYVITCAENPLKSCYKNYVPCKSKVNIISGKRGILM